MKSKSTAEKARPRTRRKGVLESGVYIPAPQDVEDYLRLYPGLAPVLPKIVASARREWGEDAELSLELYRDPEVDDAYLTLYVRPSRRDPRIMERINRIARTFEQSLAQQPGHVLITTDFRPPRGCSAI